MSTASVELEAEIPSRLSWALFAAKQRLLRLKRAIQEAPSTPRRLRAGEEAGFGHLAGASRTGLWIESHPAERRLEAGKVQNLRLAAAALDGLVIPAGEVFSFWRQVGAPTAKRGFVEGRMLQQGCMVASVGGGLCQLSNGLYEAALEADCEIIERHRHSRRVPGSQAVLGRDATVAWNYVDLRFRPQVAMRLGVSVDDESLSVTLSRQTPPQARRVLEAQPEPALATASSCATCGRDSCSLHEGA
jgi:vancomycin resistance protein YoaR